MIEVRPVEEVRIFDIDRAKAEQFAARVAAEFNVRAKAVDQAQDAVKGCDLVVTIAAADAPVLDGAW